MGSRPIAAAQIGIGIGLIACGAGGVAAWQNGLWGSLTGAILAAIWLMVLNAWPGLPAPLRRPVDASAEAEDRVEEGDATTPENAMVLRVLLDAAPTPLLSVDAGVVRALNRAARRLFATDDRVLSPPAALPDRHATRCRYEGRGWRIDRVDVAQGSRMVVALIDIEQEERAAQARATADMIQILGHEVLNGLAPIVSLAESGLAALKLPNTSLSDTSMPGAHGALLPDILGTLARRAEGLQRFTEAYRALARLPEPVARPVAIAELIDDLARLFRGRYPAVALTVQLTGDPPADLDRDQISQALWAILQNTAEAQATRVTLVAYTDIAGLRIDIGDDGFGVPLHETDRIFRPFHTAKPDGTGIGLSLARQIAHAHGGTLTLLPSQPTTFALTLPGKPSAPPL